MTNNPSDLERLLADLDNNQRDGEAHFNFGIRLARARTRLDGLAPDLARKVITLQARVEELEAAGRALISDVRRRYPGEELRCPLMRALDAALQPNTTEE